MATRVVLVAFAVLVASPALTAACSCNGPTSFEEALRVSHYVFKGPVIAMRPAVEHGPNLVVATLQVAAWWKGAPSEVVEVLTVDNTAACGFPFFVGSEYLVYVSPNESGSLWEGLCSRTHAVYPGDPDLEALGPPHSLPVTARTWQQIKKLYR
ncbi:MAG TPA: hypothetical protein VFD07_02765 [Candidatus Krumholzibacteria bacterium]|nr:hypothetical protein [Candidatus Krumholzibacteria bacterium]